MTKKHIVILMGAYMLGVTLGMVVFAANPVFPEANTKYQRQAEKTADSYNQWMIDKQALCEAEIELATAKLHDSFAGFRDLEEGESKIALIRKSEYMSCMNTPDDSVNFVATENGGIEEFLAINASEDVKGHAETFKTVGKLYGIAPELLVCIAQADSSLGRYVKTANNIGNVGNTDNGRTKTFATLEAGIEAIAQTLSNSYLGHYTTIGELSRGGGNQTGAIYASSPYNWNKNTLGCMSDILKQDIDEQYNFRTDTVVE